ncbi:glycosyltransferase [Microvirga pudoricolor]|uniref:glycosyltransferase n=1 Tax=Microvirga pudoricolor TaxID=2778729 RepID=UPI0019508E30|nr:glycosyltransferase [Microvirga pudoricolor]MBM6593436.1 glycosyltransferase [Microvirga pudoricolor]
MAGDFVARRGANIGNSGSNLTISFLSLNRVNLSERLCDSIAKHIPDFAGEVLAVDNGSTPEALEQLRQILARQPYRTRLIELEKNHGVGGGRNATIPHVATEWLMCLDNDIYFLSNPLQRLQQDIGALGAHFMSLPLLDPDHKTLFAYGGLLHITYDLQGSVSVGGGSAFPQTAVETYDGPGFLSSFMYGGSCVFKVSSFERVGGYDEALFIGFEDTDLSLRLFRDGYKVGTTGAIALVHDHPPPDTDNDVAYEQKRFSTDILRRSAKHLEQKYGYKFWDDVTESWLAERQASLGVVSEPVGPAGAVAKSRPKIGLVVDTVGWAFDNIAHQIVTHLSSDFAFDILASYDIGERVRLLPLLQQNDLVHFFWRQDPLSLQDPGLVGELSKFGISTQELRDRYLSNRAVTTSVYDHLFLGADDIERFAPLFQSVTGYSVSSQRLHDIYSEISAYPPPSMLIPDGVDLDRFRKGLSRRPRDRDRPLVVGWAGNSAWAADIEDFKGVHTILKPALSELNAEGIPLDSYFADRQIRMIPHHDMPDYYASIDVFVCVSKIEGTPNPVLEAMACGVPVISTDVGIVPQAFGPKQRDFILASRSKEDLKKALRRLHHERSLLDELSAENLISIQDWSWPQQVQKFKHFFNGMLAKAHET